MNRLMIRFSMPVEFSNELVSSGKIGKIFGQLMEDLKPEAAYFFPEKGNRSGFFIVNLNDSSDMVKMVEPLWLGLHADITVTPVVNGDDLGKGLGGIEGIVKRYT
jgi:hypothetical protein